MTALLIPHTEGENEGRTYAELYGEENDWVAWCRRRVPFYPDMARRKRMTIGRKAHDLFDQYETPPALTEAFLRAWWPRVRDELPGRPLVLEPAAGAGSMIAPIRNVIKRPRIHALDVVGTHPLDNFSGADMFELGQDFFAWEAPRRYDLVITNPPFNAAMAFIERALELTKPGGYVVMLLRLAFLESERRKPWLERHMPAEVWVLSKRPSFNGSGTDSAAYAWFVWKQGRRGRTFKGRLL